MNIIDFYGKSIRIRDISTCTVRASKPGTIVFGLFNGINIFLFFAVIIALSALYLTDEIEGGKAFIIGLVVLASLAGIEIILGKIFTKTTIVEVAMISGDKVKSPKMTRNDAESLQVELTKKINSEI